MPLGANKTGERLDLTGDHREPLAGIARARRLDRGIQCQEIGLAAALAGSD